MCLRGGSHSEHSYHSDYVTVLHIGYLLGEGGIRDIMKEKTKQGKNDGTVGG